jgi:cold shock CspA family protein
MIEHGIVKWFNDAKDYGFILSDDGSSILVEKWNINADPQVLFELQH